MQGPSPDEVALVEAARQVGFEFKNRSMSAVTLNIFGEDIVFELLNVMEYTSERWVEPASLFAIGWQWWRCLCGWGGCLPLAALLAQHMPTAWP